LATSICAPAMAQTFPDHPIRLVVVFPAGGPFDIVARVVSQAMGERLGQPIVVENRGGAGGIVGTEFVAKSNPDGYTMALTSAGALSISPNLQKMPYRSTIDLKPITLVARVPEIMVVAKDSPAKTMADFIKMAKEKAGALNFASSGPGGLPHLAGELLMKEAGIKMTHVPFSGTAPATLDVLAGRSDMEFSDIPGVLGNIQAGTLRGLGIGSPERFPGLPDIPTMTELGLPGVTAVNWQGFVVAGATPAPIAAKLNQAAVATLHDPKVVQTLREQGAVLVGDSPEEFTAWILSEEKRWGEVTRAANIKLD